MKRILALLLLLLPLSVFSQSFVNTKHLDYLYEEKQFTAGTIGFVHIYAEAPDYKYVEAAKEGISCVDDVARADVLYGILYKKTPTETIYRKIAGLSRYLLYVQNPNGLYNNFIYADGSINTVFKTSVAEPDWWSWRAIWGLVNVYEIVLAKDETLAKEIQTSLKKAVTTVLPLYVKAKEYKDINGVSVPQWLPADGGADQAAVLVKGLTKYFQLFRDSTVLPVVSSLCDGIMALQVKDSASEVNGALLSWQNAWHGWGNNQSDALLDAYEITRDNRYLSAALLEINSFYPWVQRSGYLLGFIAGKENAHVRLITKEQFSQIAYNIRPMVFACLHANSVTGDQKYFDAAILYAGWLFGDNPAKKPMYSPRTGRCYDGINSETSVNVNSGAESTIEALLSLAAIESSPHGLQALAKQYRVH
jgi:hypothetical protein